MKKTAKKLLSMALVLVMVLSLLPATAMAAGTEGSSTKSAGSGAFGISTPSEMTSEEQAASENNPFGAKGENGAFPLLVKSELYVTYGWGGSDKDAGKNYVKSFDLTDDEGEAEFKVNYGAMVGYNENDLGASGNAYIAAAVDGFNPGSGKDEYVAMLGLNAQDKRLELSITDKNGQPVSVTMSGTTYIEGNRSGDKLTWLTNDTEFYQMNGFLSVASGDFDGDGVDSIIMYEVGAGNSQVPSLREYKVTKNGEFLVISSGDLVMGTAGMYSVLGGDVSNMSKTEAKNAPKVQMEAADTDKDGYDELVVTVSMNDTHEGESMKHLGTQVFIYDKLDTGWTLTARFSAKGANGDAVPAVAPNNSCAAERYRMVWGTSTVGNVIASDDSGVMTDFPEIVTVGMQDNESTDMHNINVDGNDKLVYSIIHCTGMDGDDEGMKNYQGVYEAVKAGTLAANNFTKAGFYESEDVSPLLQTKCFSYKGAAEAEAVFISGSVYAWDANGGNGELTHLYTQRMFTVSAKMADGDKVSNMQVESVAAGNFDGNDDGREQVAAAFLLKKEGTGNGYIAMKTVGYYGAEDGDDTDADNWYNGEGDSYFVKKKGNSYVALTDFDFDADSVIVKYEGVEKQWSDPEVMAILVASPYFHDIGLENNSCTDYGVDHSTETSSEESHTLTTNFVVGYEATTLLGNGGGAEATIENNLTWSSNNSRTITYSTNFSNNTEENQVVVYRSPTLVYHFTNINNGEDVYLSKALSIVSTMISVEEYNEQAASYNDLDMDIIDESKLGTPGIPNSYPSDTSQITNAVDSKVLLGDVGLTSYRSGGTTTKGVTMGEASGKSFNYEFDFSFTAYGLIFGAKIGGGAGYGYETTTSVVNGLEISRSGTVDGSGVPENYDFNWNFATWSIELNDLTIPVCGYVVQNVTAPPSPGMGLTAENITTDSVTLRWSSGIRPANQYRIYRVLENDTHVLVGAVQGDQTSFTLTGLRSDDAYTYVVRGVGYRTGKAVESVDSAPVTVRTQSENSKVRLTLFKQDGTSLPDGNILQSTGDDAGLKVQVTGTNGGNRSYQWQLLEAGAEGIKNGWLSVSDLPSSMIGTVAATGDTLTLNTIDKSLNGSYLRCVVTVISTAGDLDTYYSPVATLDLNGLDTTTKITVTGNTGGSGSITAPYTGTADYAAITEEKTTIDVYVPATVKDGNGVEYTIYKDTEKNVYVGVHDEVDAVGNTSNRTYRVVTKDGETYTLGDLLAPSEDKYFKDSSTTYNTTQYADFNGVSTVFETVGTVTYLKQYAVAESSLTEYWYNMTDGLYYTKSGNSFTKASSQPGSNADLRVVYYDNGSTVILSAVGEDNYDHYQVYTVANGSATAGDSFYRVPGTTLYESGTTTVYADSANFEAVTVKKADEYITYTSTPEPGDQLTLKADVTTDKNGTVDTQVTFTITNTDTGAVTQLTTTSGTEITWTAPRHGLYRIVATAAATTSTKSSSSECYYRADDPNNDYRLAVKQNGEQVTNISYNGGSVTLELKKRTNGTWDAVSGVSYKVNNTDFAGSYTPNAAGTYIFSALVDGKTVATAVLVVNKVSITVTPTWTGAVPAYSDIELVATDAQGNDVTLVNGYMTVSCDLYKGTDIDPEAASGVYTVTPAYVSSKMEEFLSRYSVTINTANIYYFSDRITVYFDAGENGEVYASYIDPSGTEFSFSDGSQISMDYGLKFVAEPTEGWSVNTWKVAVPSTDPSVSETDVTEYFSRYGSTLKIAEDDLKKLMEENGANTLTVSVTFTNQAHKITYSADDGGSLSATAGGGDLASDTSVAPNTTVTFTATPADGQMVEKWTVDGLDYKWDGTNALYRENTLTLENIDSAHVVKVFFTDTDTTTVSVSAVDTAGVSYSGATVTVTDAEGNAIEDLTSVPQSNALTFTAKIGNTSSAMVKEWQTSTDGENWTTVSGSGQKNAITIYEHGASLYVRVVIAVAQTYTLNWEIEMEDGSDVPDEVKDSLTVCSGDADIENGAALAANVSVDFTLDLAEGYEVVDWDGADVNPDDNGKASISNLTSNTKVVVTIREKPTVTINFSVVDTNGAEAGGTNGTLTAAVGAKSLSNGDTAYVQETVTFTAAPDTDYRVKEWRLNGDVQENTGSTFELLLTEGMAEDSITVTVQFMPKGDKLMFYSEGNGSIQDVAVAGISYDFANGLTAAEGAEVVITAAPGTGYEVKAWKVDGVTQVGQTDNTFTYVATGDTGADITVVFQSVAYTVNWTAENGTVTAEGQTGSPAQIRGGETVTFTAEPDDGYVFDHWVVNGETVVGATNPFTWQVPEGEPTNTVHTVEAVFERENVQYTVTYSAVGSGTISAAGGEGGSVTVASGDSITFTATPATNYMVQEWQLDGTTIPGTANRLTYELTNVMGTHRVTVVFKAAVLYQVGYGVEGTDGTLTAKMNGNSLTLADGVTADVPAGSKLEFTAEPDTGTTNYMVANWTVNGTPVTRDNMAQLGVTMEHYLSNTLTVESLSKNMDIQVSFTKYMGYTIPTDGPGYTVTGVERNPAVTYENAPADEVRKNGDLSFTISPDSANGYSTISSIKLGDTELLTDDPNDNITVVKNSDGSYTVTITDVQSVLDLTVTAHKLVITSGLDGYTPPAALVSQGLDTPEKIQTKLETKLTVSSDGKVFYDIALKYYDSETNGWVEVTEGNFPSSGVDVVLPYPTGADGYVTSSKDTFTIVHMLTTTARAGEMETVSYTKQADGLHFHVTSLSPFGVSWTKYTAPAGGGSGGGGGGGGGAASTTETITIKDSVNGKVTADNTNAEEGDTVTLTVEPDKGYTLETLTVTDGSGKEVKLTAKDGKYTFTMPASKVTIKATFMEDNSMLNFFVDVPADAYYYDAVLWAAENGITGGVDDTHFAPYASCTRAQAVTFLWRAAGCPAPKSTDMPFTDVAEGSYYHDAVLWAVENGITKGTSDTTFTPNATCTRAQIVTFLWRSQKSPASDSVNPFTDVAADAYYANAVLWAVENGITGGTTATTFSPNNDCTRAQIVTFLYRRMK